MFMSRRGPRADPREARLTLCRGGTRGPRARTFKTQQEAIDWKMDTSRWSRVCGT